MFDQLLYNYVVSHSKLGLSPLPVKGCKISAFSQLREGRDLYRATPAVTTPLIYFLQQTTDPRMAGN